MAKALLGTYIPADSLRLLDEIQLLRRRIEELEAALDAAQQAHQPRAEDGLDPDTSTSAHEHEPATA